METTPQSGHTATLVLPLLEPGTTYQYTVTAGRQTTPQYSFTTQSLWHWRRDPPTFSFLAGSCVYINDPAYDRPGKGYGGDYQILEHMGDEDADFMVWLGDNTYFREVDYWSRSGLYYRHSHTRRTAEMQSLLRSMHHYAIWDDHDYGPNDSEWTYALKGHARDAFDDYWPSTNRIIDDGGITSHFVWNDCEYFLLDNRWYREPVGDSAAVIGDLQREWLIDALRWSKATYKFVAVGGQFLSTAQLFENMSRFGQERQAIIDAIDQYGISGVVFLTGDRHHSEVSKLTSKTGQTIYDITASPITSTAYDHSGEPNTLRHADSTIGQRNYAIITVSGPLKARELSVTFKDSEGQEIASHKLY